VLRFLLLSSIAVLAIAQDFPAKADAYVQSWTRDGLFRGTILVAKDGQPLFRKGYGLANAEWDIPNSPETRFRLGSITKQFTAVAILQLAGKNKLKLSDPVKLHYPDAPATWDKITIHHLLNHTSGIKSYTGLKDFFAKQSRQARTPSEIVKLTQDMPLEFEPGVKFAYNNTGYVLLGEIIEKVSGQSYATYLHQNVFTPLAMADSGYDSPTTILKRRASGYQSNGTKNADFLDMSLPHAAGSLYSTVDDLLKWAPEKLVSPESFAKMTTPGKGKYAYGLIVDELKDHRVHAHGGGINGFSTFLARFPDDKLTVVVLANQETPAPQQIALDLARMSFGENISPRPVIAKVDVPAARLDQLTGRYEIAPNFVLRVWRDGEKMLTQGTGQGVAEVISIDENTLAQTKADARLVFQRGADGKATSLTIEQGGRGTPAKRIGD